MIVVYALKDTPTRNDIELRYSLRSIPYDKVYIVTGKKRDWIQNVHWIECKDVLCRYESVKRKVVEACKVIGKPFLFMNDDMYLLEPFKQVDYYNGYLKDKPIIGSKQQRIFKSAMAESRDGRNYSVHSPMIIEPTLMEGINSLSFKDVHGSLSGRKKVQMADVKMRTKKDHSREFIEGLPFFSTSDFSFGLIRELMDDLFPEPSVYEI